MPAFRILLMAASWALLTAGIHVSVVLFRVHVLRGFTLTTQLFALASPVAYIVVFCVPALLLVLAARIRPGMVTERVVTGILAGLSVFCVLLLYRKIHPWSYLVLASGAGWQVARLFQRNGALARVLTGRLAPALTLVLALAGFVPLATAAWREGTAMRSSIAAADARPNVLLLILDTVRASSMSTYGYARPTTPAIDSLSRESAVFDYAFSTASWSLPSHTSLLTGVWGHETGGDYLRRPYDSLRTVAEVLRDAGYLTGAFMGNAGWAGHETGLTRGFLRYTTYRFDASQLLWATTITQTPLVQGVIGGLATASPRRLLRALASLDFQAKTPPTANGRRADEVAGDFLAWRDRIPPDRTWFAMLNLMDAHDPYRTPFEARFNDGRTAMDRYDGAIAWLDRNVSRIVAELRATGDLDRTLVIVTSDHGEKFGEHGEYFHSGGLYLPVVHVPLLIRFPSLFPAGSRRAGLVSLADIPATILDVAGERASGIPGRSLVNAAQQDDSAYALFISNRRLNPVPDDRTAAGDVLSVLTDQWHLIRYGDGAEELYRWRTDSTESVNLSASADGQAVLPGLRRLLTASSSSR